MDPPAQQRSRFPARFGVDEETEAATCSTRSLEPRGASLVDAYRGALPAQALTKDIPADWPAAHSRHPTEGTLVGPPSCKVSPTALPRPRDPAICAGLSNPLASTETVAADPQGPRPCSPEMQPALPWGLPGGPTLPAPRARGFLGGGLLQDLVSAATGTSEGQGEHSAAAQLLEAAWLQEAWAPFPGAMQASPFDQRAITDISSACPSFAPGCSLSAPLGPALFPGQRVLGPPSLPACLMPGGGRGSAAVGLAGEGPAKKSRPAEELSGSNSADDATPKAISPAERPPVVSSAGSGSPWTDSPGACLFVGGPGAAVSAGRDSTAETRVQRGVAVSSETGSGGPGPAASRPLPDGAPLEAPGAVAGSQLRGDTWPLDLAHFGGPAEGMQSRWLLSKLKPGPGGPHQGDRDQGADSPVFGYKGPPSVGERRALTLGSPDLMRQTGVNRPGSLVERLSVTVAESCWSSSAAEAVNGAQAVVNRDIVGSRSFQDCRGSPGSIGDALASRSRRFDEHPLIFQGLGVVSQLLAKDRLQGLSGSGGQQAGALPCREHLAKRPRLKPRAADGTVCPRGGANLAGVTRGISCFPELDVASAKQAEVLRGRLLMAAEALHRKDMGSYSRLYMQLKSCAKSKGLPIERLVHYTLQGLHLRSTGQGSRNFAEPLRRNQNEAALASKWFVDNSPVMPFYTTFTLQALFQYLCGEERAHIVDLGAAMLPRWHLLFELFRENRDCPRPRHLRITIANLSPMLHPRRRPIRTMLCMKSFGANLERVAASVGIHLRFENLVAEQRAWEQLQSGVERAPGEKLLVCTSFHWMHVPVQGPGESPKDFLLTWVRELGPTAVLAVEMDLEAAGVEFLPRFRASIDYYYAFFDLVESLCGQISDRGKLRLYEELYASCHLINLVSCEGESLEVEPESQAKIHSRFSKAGFVPLELGNELINAISENSVAHRPNCSLILQPGSVGLAWRRTLLIHASIWKTSAIC